MDRLNKIIISFILCLTQLITAQTYNNTLIENDIIQKHQESIFVHINTATLVVGEKLLYNIFCLNASDFKKSKASTIAYIELIDSDKKTIFKHKLFLTENTGSGMYFIPTSVKTGNYLLLGYTNWMLNNKTSNIFQQKIVLINPFLNIEKKLNSTTKKLNDDCTLEKLIVKNSNIELNKKIYNTRDSVELKIKNFEKGKYSISVRKKDEYTLTLKKNSFDIEKQIPIINDFTSQNLILPETRGEIITGKITSKSNTDLENKVIALSISGNNFTFKITRTKKNGQFLFVLDKPNFQSNISIEILDNYKQDYEISVDKQNSPNYNELETDNKFSLSSHLRIIIEKKSIANQIENAYYFQNMDSITKVPNQLAFYEPTSKDYILDNYTRFKTTKETITEVLKEMYFTANDKNFKIGLREYDKNNDATFPSLVMIDGQIIQDLSELFDYNMNNIYKVSIVPGGYYYGSLNFNGIINFISKERDFESKLTGDFKIKPKIIRPYFNSIIRKINYSKNKNLDRIPDFRYQLLWETNPDLNNIIKFFTSDISGEFEIDLEGFTDNGTPISEKQYFEVK